MKTIIRLACALFLAASCVSQEAVANPKQATSATGTGTSKASGIDPHKEADIRRLMAVTGAAGLGMDMMKNMENSMKPLLERSLPAGEYRAKLIELYFQKLRAEATPESLTKLLVPVYDRHFSDDEIRQLTAFYETPLGKKAISVLPQVVSESQEAGSKWGGELGRRCMEEVLSEHPDLARELEAAQKAVGSN